MARRPSESERCATTELDPTTLRGLLDTQEREPKPTAVMHRDELLGLRNATAAAPTSLNALPRLVLEQRDKIASVETDRVAEDLRHRVSPTVVLVICGLLIGLLILLVTLDR